MRLSLLLLGSVLTAAHAYTPYGGGSGEQNPQGAPLPVAPIITNESITQHQQMQEDADTFLEELLMQLADQYADQISEDYAKEIKAALSQSSLVGKRTQMLMSIYNSPVVQQQIASNATSMLMQRVEEEIPADQRESKKDTLVKEIELKARSIRDHVNRQIQNVIEGKELEKKLKQGVQRLEKGLNRVADDVQEAIEQGKPERELKRIGQQAEKGLNRVADDVQEAFEQGKPERELKRIGQQAEKGLNRVADDVQEAIEQGKVEREVNRAAEDVQEAIEQGKPQRELKKFGKKAEKEGKRAAKNLKKLF